MPNKTLHYGLKVYDRESDKTQYFIDFRDDLAGADNSNMVKIDEALFQIFRKATSFEQVIEGDGLSKEFLVPESGSHGKNTTTPVVTLFDMDSNAPAVTAWEAVSANQIRISFNSVLPSEKKYKVLID